MVGDSLGVMLVLLLCGLIVPIAMILAAALVDVLALAWVAFSYWHDHMLPSLVRVARAAPHRFAFRPIPH